MAGIPGAAGPGAPFPQWSVNTSGYIVAEVPNASAKAIAEAVTFPDRLVFFTSQQAADRWVASQGHTPVNGTTVGQLGGQAVINAGTGAATKIDSAVGNPLAWLSNIGQFFTALTQPNLWLRVSKVLLGGVLVVAGLIKLTGTDKKVYGLAGMAASKLPGV
jgi:hypothetical protein